MLLHQSTEYIAFQVCQQSNSILSVKLIALQIYLHNQQQHQPTEIMSGLVYLVTGANRGLLALRLRACIH